MEKKGFHSLDEVQHRAPSAEKMTYPTATPMTQPLRDDEKMPLFLIKLWNIVEDPAYVNVIRWDDSGYSFHILDPYSFCRNVLPQYFKHNNLNSLIRQLNMYGFRKMTPIDRSGLARAESDQDHLEFSHPYFVREHPELLVNIKRKSTSHRPPDTSSLSLPAKNLSLVLDEIRQLREKQRTMESKMANLVKENESVWQQLSHMRTMHMKQQQVVTKLVQFLVALVQPSSQKRLGKRNLLAIDEVGGKRARMGNCVSPGNLAEVLDRLQREIAEGGVNASIPTLFSPTSNGPIIADITDEPDASGVLLGGTSTPAPSSSVLPRRQCVSPQKQDVQQQQLMNTSNQPPQNFSFSPAYLAISPSLDRQLSAELAEYLNSQEQGIDNCRELIGNQWDLNLDALEDEPGPPKPQQQQLMLADVDPSLAQSAPPTPDLLTPNTSPVHGQQDDAFGQQ